MEDKSAIDLIVEFLPAYLVLLMFHKFEPDLRELVDKKAKAFPGLAKAYYGTLFAMLALVVISLIWWFSRGGTPELRLAGTLHLMSRNHTPSDAMDFRVSVDDQLLTAQTMKAKTTETPPGFMWNWPTATSHISHVRLEFGYLDNDSNYFIVQRSCEILDLKPFMFKAPAELYVAVDTDTNLLSWKTNVQEGSETRSRCTGVTATQPKVGNSGWRQNEGMRAHVTRVVEKSDVQDTRFAAGTIRLHCGIACAFRYGWNSSNLQNLHNRNLWGDLWRMTDDIGFEEDLAYYYLARAAEGLGYVSAAGTYYQLALDEHNHCSKLFNGCSGISVLDAARAGLGRVQSLTTEKSTPMPQTQL